MFIQYIGSKIINEGFRGFSMIKMGNWFWSIIDIKKGIPLHRRGAAKSKHVHTSGLCFPSY